MTVVSLIIFFPTLALVGFDQTLVLDSSSLEQHRTELLEVILLLLSELELILWAFTQITRFANQTLWHLVRDQLLMAAKWNQSHERVESGPFNILNQVKLPGNFRVCPHEHSSVFFLFVAAKKNFQAALSRNFCCVLEVPFHERF